VSMDYQGTLVIGSLVGRCFLGAVVDWRGCRFDSVGCLL
jgi:hypothetical protein